MNDRLPRSNSQSHLPNYGQGQPDDKNKDVDKKRDGALGQSDKNTGQGHSDKNKAAPQMKSKEDKKVKASSESDSDDGAKVSDTFGRLFLGKGASAIARKYEDSDESSSEDGAAQSKSKTLKSPRQQQSTGQEKNTKKNAPKLSLKNLGNALAGLASDRREMAISPRKTKTETHRNTQEINADTGTPTTIANTNTATITTATTPTSTTANSTVAPKTFGATAISWTPASPRQNKSTVVQSAAVTTTNQSAQETKVSDKKTEKTAAVKDKSTGTVYVSDISEQSIRTIKRALSGAIVSGADLAELLVCVQSRGYKNSLAGSNTDSILRGAMSVKDFPDPNDPEKTFDVNIIEKVCVPFMKKYWDTEKIAKLRTEAMQKFDEGNLEVLDDVKALNARDLRKNKHYTTAMRPLVKLVSEQIIGKTMDVSKAPIPDEVKELLKGVDTCVIKWSKNGQKIEAEELFLARKSAIAAFVANRSFIHIWFTVFADKDRTELKKYIPMTSYLTTMLTVESDKFYFSVMSNASDQDGEQKRLLEHNKNATAFSSLVKPKKTTGKQFAATEQIKEKRAIKKEVENFLINIDESLLDSNFSEYMQTIVASSQENTIVFKQNPAQFVLDSLNDYWFSFDSTDGGDLFIESTTLGKLKQLLEIKIESEKTDDSGKATTSTVATNTTITTTSTTTTTTNTNPTQASSEEDSSPRKQ